MTFGLWLATSACNENADLAKAALDGGGDSGNGGNDSGNGGNRSDGGGTMDTCPVSTEPVGACSSNGQSCGPYYGCASCTCDHGTWNCAGGSCDAAGPDSSGDDGGPDAKADGSAPPDASVLSCPETIDAYCATDSGPLTPCRQSFASVQATLPSPCNPQVMPATQETATCGGYETWSIFNVDSSYTAYYDAQSGQLVAIEYFSAPGSVTTCLAGPPTFAEPASCSNMTWYCN
jgi:hypothetical protein